MLPEEKRFMNTELLRTDPCVGVLIFVKPFPNGFSKILLKTFAEPRNRTTKAVLTEGLPYLGRLALKNEENVTSG